MLGQQTHLPCLISAVFNLKAWSSFFCSRSSMQHESLPADAESRIRLDTGRKRTECNSSRQVGTHAGQAKGIEEAPCSRWM